MTTARGRAPRLRQRRGYFRSLERSTDYRLFEQPSIEWRAENFCNGNPCRIRMRGVQQKVMRLLADCRRHLQQPAAGLIEPSISNLSTCHGFSSPIYGQFIYTASLEWEVGGHRDAQQLIG